MCAAVYFHLASTGLQGFPLGHVENYSYNFEEPALYACIFLFFSFVGAGPKSVDGLSTRSSPRALTISARTVPQSRVCETLIERRDGRVK